MNLLFLTSFYPPHHLGGTGLLCHEVATELISRGHTVNVLTSTYGATRESTEPGVHRRLRLQSDIHYYRPRQVLHYFPDRRANLRVVRETLSEVQPDVVLVWGMWNLSWSVVAEMERILESKVAYYLTGAWPTDLTPHESFWTGRGRSSWGGRVLLRLLRPLVARVLRDEWQPYPLRFQHTAVCSRSVEREMCQAGIGPDDYRLIYHGIDADAYRTASLDRPSDTVDGKLRVVFVGSLLPQKGVHTAIEALSCLVRRGDEAEITLDILGAGHPQYEDRLHRMVNENGLTSRVRFHQPISRAELPAFLASYDVLVLPSVWEEHLALISEEAMASGLVVVGTLTGGTPEILSDGVNGLAFGRENPEELADQLVRLAHDEALRSRLTQAAWETIQERFTMAGMLDEMEAWLKEIAA